jgi:hypothetical protein
MVMTMGKRKEHQSVLEDQPLYPPTFKPRHPTFSDPDNAKHPFSDPMIKYTWFIIKKIYGE